MIALNVRVDDTSVQLNLRSMQLRVQERVRETVRRQAIAVQARAKEKLSGPVLKNRTGRLRRSVNVRESATTGGGLVATIGTNVPYAAIHEYGFDGIESVRAYVRRVKSRDVRVGGKRAASGVAFVRAHERHMHMPERSFLRSSLRELMPSIRDAFHAAVAEAVR